MTAEERISYPFDTKLAAVRAHVEEGLTSTEAMAKYGIKSKSAFFRWCATYKEQGEAALKPLKRGRPRKSM